MSDLRFIKITDTDQVAKYLCTRISEALVKGQKVLWLVPGGSSIKIAIRVSQWLKGNDLSNLTVALTDERYGEVGHVDSNWQQLSDGGFDLPGADMQPVLTGKDMESTVSQYGQLLKRLFDVTDFKIGFFGVGPDGHTAGILPGSSAIESQEMAAGYDAGNFKRVTMTTKAIQRLDEAVVYASGSEKLEALDNLERTLTLQEQPAQILKTVNMLRIYNDQKGSEE